MSLSINYLVCRASFDHVQLALHGTVFLAYQQGLHASISCYDQRDMRLSHGSFTRSFRDRVTESELQYLQAYEQHARVVGGAYHLKHTSSSGHGAVSGPWIHNTITKSIGLLWSDRYSR